MIFQTEVEFTSERLNEGHVPGICHVIDERSEDKTKLQTVVTISSDITGKSFVHLLEFLYTGK